MTQRNSLVNNHRFKAAVQNRRQHSILKGGYKYRFIYKLVLRPPQAFANLAPVPATRSGAPDSRQHFKIRRDVPRLLAGTRHPFAKIYR